MRGVGGERKVCNVEVRRLEWHYRQLTCWLRTLGILLLGCQLAHELRLDHAAVLASSSQEPACLSAMLISASTAEWLLGNLVSITGFSGRGGYDSRMVFLFEVLFIFEQAKPRLQSGLCVVSALRRYF